VAPDIFLKKLSFFLETASAQLRMDEVALAPPWLVRIIKCITDNGKGCGPHDKRYK